MSCNQLPVFTQDMNNLALSENTPVGSVVYTLQGVDPQGLPVRLHHPPYQTLSSFLIRSCPQANARLLTQWSSVNLMAARPRFLFQDFFTVLIIKILFRLVKTVTSKKSWNSETSYPLNPSVAKWSKINEKEDKIFYVYKHVTIEKSLWCSGVNTGPCYPGPGLGSRVEQKAYFKLVSCSFTVKSTYL